MRGRGGIVAIAAFAALAMLWGGWLVAFGNAGPFVVKYPGGNPSAKGVLARLDPDLKPAREERLRVLKEDLGIVFSPRTEGAQPTFPPVARVTAAYTIENPTGDEITIDFGFPILRGIYMSPLAMMPRPDVTVTQDGKGLRTQLISNSMIYGMIRQRARAAIEKAIEADGTLASLVRRVRGASQAGRSEARAALAEHLKAKRGWKPRSVALMVEYASIDLGPGKSHPIDGSVAWFPLDPGAYELMRGNLGPLSAIGEQKATQFVAQVASLFDPKAGTTYEAIFSAWGGDVRERSVDLGTGRLRPRELSDAPRQPRIAGDPTVYARVDYLDASARISDAEKASCKAILANLPVIFTFAPMNLLHYQAKFPPHTTVVLTVTYRQYPYLDTRPPTSHQLAYVVHPASLWKSFGPINLTVDVPVDAKFNASVRCRSVGVVDTTVPLEFGGQRPMKASRYQATLHEKTGELFVAIGADTGTSSSPRAK